jgi:phosphatidylserine/phosphatidylglycerophosphate/cardiolipin synthase-like enzyme
MQMYGEISSQPELITSGKAFTEFVMTRVRQSLTEILINTYTLEFDAVGQALLSELEYACQRGLRVHCLIDARGSQNFIRDHPALFSKLETQIRIKHSRLAEDNCVVFDRQLAVIGTHTLCEPNMEHVVDGELVSRIVSGVAVTEIASTFDKEWQKAGENSDHRIEAVMN